MATRLHDPGCSPYTEIDSRQYLRALFSFYIMMEDDATRPTLGGTTINFVWPGEDPHRQSFSARYRPGGNYGIQVTKAWSRGILQPHYLYELDFEIPIPVDWWQRAGRGKWTLRGRVQVGPGRFASVIYQSPLAGN